MHENTAFRRRSRKNSSLTTWLVHRFLFQMSRLSRFDSNYRERCRRICFLKHLAVQQKTLKVPSTWRLIKGFDIQRAFSLSLSLSLSIPLSLSLASDVLTTLDLDARVHPVSVIIQSFQLASYPAPASKCALFAPAD